MTDCYMLKHRNDTCGSQICYAVWCSYNKSQSTGGCVAAPWCSKFKAYPGFYPVLYTDNYILKEKE